MRPVIFISLFLAAAVLTGCKSSNPLPKDFYSDSPENRFPPVSVFAKKPSNELASLCEQNTCQWDGLQVDNLYRELEKSQMFQAFANERISAYQIRFTARSIDYNATVNGAKMVASAATLFVVPTQLKKEYRSEFQVSWNGFELAEYQFAIPYEETFALYKEPRQADRFAAESTASKFIASAQRDGIFTSDFLYAKLQAENYPRDLHVPVHVGEYEHVLTYVYPDPFLGAQLNFKRTGKSAEKTDVFVYPIRQVEWHDAEKTLEEEIDSARKEIDLAVKQGAYKTADFGENQTISFSRDGKIYTGKVTVGTITSEPDQNSDSLIYLFMNKDKFVKIRMTRPATEDKLTRQQADKFIAELLPQLSVPDESYFMANLRRNKRNTGIR